MRTARMQTKRVFEQLTSRTNLPQLEREILDLWEREGTYEASLDRRRGAPRWVFYEGPPTANGEPGTHHVLARAFKDLFPRYRTMKASSWSGRPAGTRTVCPSSSRSKGGWGSRASSRSRSSASTSSTSSAARASTPTWTPG